MAEWKNRIIAHGEETPDQLLANPLNYRIHNWYQEQILRGVFEEVGLVDTVKVNTTTGHMVDGHLRVAMAIRDEQRYVPVTYVELSPEEERVILATFDPVSMLAGTDREMLDQLLEDTDTNNANIAQLWEEMRNGDVSEWSQSGADGFDPVNATSVLYRVVIDDLDHDTATGISERIADIAQPGTPRVEGYRKREQSQA